MSEEYRWGEGFQRKLLSLYIRKPDKTFEIIEPGYFTSPIHSEIAGLVRNIYKNKYREGVRLSKETLLSLVKGSLGKKRRDIYPEYRREIRQAFEDEVKDSVIVLSQASLFAKEQKFRQALVDAEKDINALKYDKAIERFHKLKGFGEEKGSSDLGIDYWKGIDDPLRWVEDREGLVGTFYFPRLDSMMGGGLGSGELGIILAGGKVGKSTMLARFAAGALWQGKNVAIATGELSAIKYRKRIDAMFSVTPTWKLTHYGKGFLDDNQKLMKALARAQRRLSVTRNQAKGSLWIKQWPSNKGKISDIEDWLDRLRDEQGVNIDILYVDYVRVFRPAERYEEQRLSIGQVCLDLRGLAVERNIPVWTAAQTNRAALTKEFVGPQDMAEDISQFWTLDFLVALCQTANEAEKDPEQARLLLTAARDVGQGGMVKIFLKRDTFRVWENKKWIEKEKKGWSERKQKTI